MTTLERLAVAPPTFIFDREESALEARVEVVRRGRIDVYPVVLPIAEGWISIAGDASGQVQITLLDIHPADVIVGASDEEPTEVRISGLRLSLDSPLDCSVTQWTDDDEICAGRAAADMLLDGKLAATNTDWGEHRGLVPGMGLGVDVFPAWNAPPERSETLELNLSLDAPGAAWSVGPVTITDLRLRGSAVELLPM